MKLKINKKTGLIAGIVIFLAAAGYLGLTTIQKIDEKTNLQTQLTTSQNKLVGIKLDSLSAQPADLQTELAQLSDNLTNVKTLLSNPITSANATAVLFDAAAKHGLSVSMVTSSDPTNESIQGITLSGITIKAKVEGALPKLVDFVAELNRRLTPSVIKSVEISVPTLSGSANMTASVTENTTANIEMVIYAYRGE